jgi:hypothetical protein
VSGEANDETAIDGGLDHHQIVVLDQPQSICGLGGGSQRP